MQKFIGGIGCFWDETKYEGIAGITSTECGYCGGKSPNVSYKEVCEPNNARKNIVWPTSYSSVILIKISMNEKKRTLIII